MQGKTRCRIAWRRLIPRLSVRALMILVLIFGGWLGWVVHRARVQRDAVAAIEKARCEVYYDFEFQVPQGGPVGGRAVPAQNSPPRWPGWLVDRLGVDYFGHVVEVDLFGRASDAKMAQIGQLDRVKTLILCQSPVTDAGLVQLEGMAELEGLHLGGTGVGDAGMAHLEGLTGLKQLKLDDTQVGDAGLDRLRGLTGLRLLVLSNTRVTDSGLSPLKRMTGLEFLSLAGTRVTDDGLSIMEGLTQLESLDLRDTRVSDAGLVHLKGLTRLGDLRLSMLHVSEAGVAGLQKSLPGAKISLFDKVEPDQQ